MLKKVLEEQAREVAEKAAKKPKPRQLTIESTIERTQGYSSES